MKDASQKKKVIITGGGSGGHTVTALSVVDELQCMDAGSVDRILYVGGKRGMEGEKNAVSVEERMVSAKKIPYIGIRSGKLQRKFALRTLIGLFGVFGGLVDSLKIFTKYDVSYVFSSGGYVSVPVCIAAWLKKVPVTIHEQTTRVGLSNKLSSLFAEKILIGYEESKEFFSPRKTVFVGNTIRKESFDEDFDDIELKKKLERFAHRSKEYPVVMIAGGGQGSHVINTIVKIGLVSLVSHFQIIILTGDNKVKKDFDSLERAVHKLPKDHQDRVILMKFATAQEMGSLYRAAEIYVGRSGAMSTYELGVMNLPAVLVPIPWVTRNEQYYNAKVLEDVGLAKIVAEGVLSPEILFREVRSMATKIRGGNLRVDEKSRSRVFIVHAAKKIADILESKHGV